MNYFLYNDSALVHITTEHPWTGTPQLKKFFNEAGEEIVYNTIYSKADFKTLEEAEMVVADVTEKTGEQWILVDTGDDHFYKRFDVIPVPKVGDDVSRGFNGDYSHVGKIVRVTPSLTVIAEDENGHQTRFRRVRKTASWKEERGYAYMVAGVQNRWNPEF